MAGEYGGSQADKPIAVSAPVADIKGFLGRRSSDRRGAQACGEAGGKQHGTCLRGTCLRGTCLRRDRVLHLKPTRVDPRSAQCPCSANADRMLTFLSSDAASNMRTTPARCRARSAIFPDVTNGVRLPETKNICYVLSSIVGATRPHRQPRTRCDSRCTREASPRPSKGVCDIIT
jgi:hypothetical protein